MARVIFRHRTNFFIKWFDMWVMRNTLTELAKDGTCESDGDIKVTTLMDLPEDVTVDILTRLPADSLCRVQCVSKTFLNISRSPDFVALHNLRLHESTMVSLMHVTRWWCTTSEWQSWKSFRYNSRSQTLSESKHVSQNCFNEDYFNVDFVFYNLFFLRTSRENGPCLLVNPLRGEVLELPRSNIPIPTTDIGSKYTDWFGMGYDNITRTYKIVRVSANIDSNCVVAQVLVLGTSSWRQIHLAPPFWGERSMSATYVGGHMHWLIYKTTENPGCIISFDFNREELYATVVPSPSRYPLKLLRFRGSLALVDLHPDEDEDEDEDEGEDNIKIWVLKSFDDEKKWELHHDIRLECLLKWIWSEAICAEWEHGICFASADECYFLDLRNLSMKKEKLPPCSTTGYVSTILRPPWTGIRMRSRIFSYTESLISLKNYGRLQKQDKVYSPWIQAFIEFFCEDLYPLIFKILLGMYIFYIVLRMS